MSETSETLAFFAEGWHNYQKHLSRALARLTPEQLALRAAPHLRSIEDLAYSLGMHGLTAPSDTDLHEG